MCVVEGGGNGCKAWAETNLTLWLIEMGVICVLFFSFDYQKLSIHLLFPPLTTTRGDTTVNAL